MLDSKLVRLGAVAALAVAGSFGAQSEAWSAEKTVQIAGFGAMSGVVRSFGINTEAVLTGAIEAVNAGGGVKLADGSMAMMELTFYDDRCNAEEGISVLRRIAGSGAVVAIGPTCSNVAEPLFGILQKNVDDAGDSGLQIPVFTDTAIKGGLAKISQWAFRNVPNENQMYKSLFQWIATEHPDLKTVYGGVEEDFAHSRFTWHKVMKERSPEAGYEVLGESKWLLNDTNFTTQVRQMKKAKADIVAISAHPFTTCGVAQGDEAPAGQAEPAGRPHQLVEHGDAAGLRRAGRRHHHPDQLRAGYRGRQGRGRCGGQARRQRGPAQRRRLGDRDDPEGRHGRRGNLGGWRFS